MNYCRGFYCFFVEQNEESVNGDLARYDLRLARNVWWREMVSLHVALCSRDCGVAELLWRGTTHP
jgi:hypothetical protein